MKMPDLIHPIFFAPCGVDCMVCYRHLAARNPCPGCRSGEAGKPAHCRKCAIKSCLFEKGLSFCLECAAFPCKAVKNLDRSYRSRYQASLIENSGAVRAQGMRAFLEQERNRFICKSCGGVISLQDHLCSECGNAALDIY